MAAAVGQPTPRRAQIAATRRVLGWYEERYHGRPWNLGALETFTRRSTVGYFAVSVRALRRGDDAAFFRLLIAVAMFQRRQDQQILRILRGLTAAEVAALTDPRRLLARADGTPCACLRSAAALHDDCDLTKTPAGRGTCARAISLTCDLKVHTVLLRRYGHFGKVPTSAALSLREQGVGGVAALRRAIWARTRDPSERAVQLETALSRSWRISEKISAMYLSALTVPGLSSRRPIWSGLDYNRFVVIDSNTDLFLKSIEYCGAWSYGARRAFIAALTERLARAGASVATLGPRIVQQAMYTFMSRANRLATPADCVHEGACSRCPSGLRSLCPVARA